MSLREQILSAKDSSFESVEVPEWKTTVYVHVLTSGEFEVFLADHQSRSNLNQDFRPRLVLACVRDENGEAIFNTLEEVNSKSHRVIKRLATIATKINHFLDDDIEELKKNS